MKGFGRMGNPKHSRCHRVLKEGTAHRLENSRWDDRIGCKLDRGLAEVPECYCVKGVVAVPKKLQRALAARSSSDRVF